MDMNSTPNANRLHIAIFGRCNSGKSSLINALTGQDTALVSAVPGTTTDLVNKAMEIHGIGPCVFIDTPGFDDEGELGEMRIARTLQAIERTDIALLLCEDGDLEEEQQWIQQLNSRHIPVILILNSQTGANVLPMSLPESKRSAEKRLSQSVPKSIQA